MNSVIGKEATVYNTSGIITGYVEWEKKIRYYWIMFPDGEEVYEKATKVTVNG